MNRLACLVLAMALPVAAQVFESPYCDPCAVPGAKSAARQEAASSGSELRAQVRAKLLAQFLAAAPDGAMTRERAAAGGLGFIARHFEAMDRERRGVVSFEDYLRFLRERGAALD
jgi:hypothetical protein